MKSKIYRQSVMAAFMLLPWIGISAQTEIRTIDDLRNVANDMAGSYVLMNDLDLAEVTDWRPIGVNAEWNNVVGNQQTQQQFDAQIAFTGTFDGGGHTIANVTVNGKEFAAALFAKLTKGGLVKNVSLKNVNITGTNPVGGLAGTMFSAAEGTATVENVSVSGVVYGTGEVGGLAGRNNTQNGTEPVMIKNSYVSADVTSTGEAANPVTAGGLIGCMNTGLDLRIENSYFMGNVKALVSSKPENRAGGVVGFIKPRPKNPDLILEVKNSAVLASSIEGGSAGLITGGDIENTLPSTAFQYTKTNVYALDALALTETDVTKQAAVEFKKKDFWATTLGWDFENVWTIAEDAGYPVFKGEEGPSTSIAGVDNAAWSVYNEGNVVRIVAAEPVACTVYDLNGKLCFASLADSNEMTFTLAQGNYVVKVNNEVRKVLVK